MSPIGALSYELGGLSDPHIVNLDIFCFRQKSGIWGFRSDKVEEVAGYRAKVSQEKALSISFLTTL